MNILFFTEISPFPINGGERIRSYGLLKALSSLDYKVTAIVQNIDKVLLKDYVLPNVKYVSYEASKPSTMDYLFNTSFFLQDKKVLQLFDLEVKIKKPDLVILDFYLAGRYFSYFRKNNIPFVMGTHNAESNLIWQRPSKSPFVFFRKVQEFIYMCIHERFIYKQANAIITVSDKDTLFYSQFIAIEKIHMIPNFLDESKYHSGDGKENYIAMTANFGPFMNQEGLKWLINEVWNKELDTLFELKLIGKNSIEALNSIVAAKQYTNIKAIGGVENMLPYIDKAKMVVVPLLHGSGTRLKCLEAMALKTPIISTEIGCEGIKSNNIIKADSSLEFRNEIKCFSKNEDLGIRLYNDFMEEYSLKVNIIRIKKLIESSVKN